MCTDDISVLRSIRSATYRPSIRHEIDRSICVCEMSIITYTHECKHIPFIYCTRNSTIPFHPIRFHSIPWENPIELLNHSIPLKIIFWTNPKASPKRFRTESKPVTFLAKAQSPLTPIGTSLMVRVVLTWAGGWTRRGEHVWVVCLGFWGSRFF